MMMEIYLSICNITLKKDKATCFG